MKKPPVVRGTFHKAREFSETLRIPLGTVWPMYRLRFHHTTRRPGQVRFQRFKEGWGWQDHWWGAVKSHTGWMEKQDGAECDIRLVCSSCPQPIDYAITYVRPNELGRTIRTLSPDRREQLKEIIRERDLPPGPLVAVLINGMFVDAQLLWTLIETPSSPLFEKCG